jgi:hypothetical protein
MKYATTTQLKNHLAVTGTDRDTYFSDVLERVSRLIDTYTGREFGVASVDVSDELHEHIGRIPFTLWLKNVGVLSITAISGRDKQTDSWTALDPADYDWTSIGRLDVGRRYRYIKVSYTYDGGGTTVPADVVQATLELAAAEVASGSGDVTKTRIGDLEMTYKAGTTDTKAAYAALDGYRVRSV